MTLGSSQKGEFTKFFLRFFGRFCDCACGGVSQGFSCFETIRAELTSVKKSTLARDRPSPYGLDNILIMILIISTYAKNVKKFLVGFWERGSERSWDRQLFVCGLTAGCVR